MDLDGRGEHNPHGGGNTYELERALGEDLLLTSVGWANSYYQVDHDYVDEWGVGWRLCEYETPFGQGYYTEMPSIRSPTAAPSAATGHPTRTARAIPRRRAAHPRVRRDYFIVGVTVTTIFETAWALRGLEQMMMDFVDRSRPGRGNPRHPLPIPPDRGASGWWSWAWT